MIFKTKKVILIMIIQEDHILLIIGITVKQNLCMTLKLQGIRQNCGKILEIYRQT